MAGRIFYHNGERVAMTIVVLFFFIILVPFGLLIFCLALLLGRSEESKKEQTRVRHLHEQANLLLETLGLKPDERLPKDVQKLALAGQKIEAIKRYHEQTGVSLKEAKDAVEGQESLASLEHKIGRVLRELHVTQAVQDTSPTTKDASSALDEIENLVRQNQLIAAIKQYREVNGSSLYDAKVAVEQIQLRQRER